MDRNHLKTLIEEYVPSNMEDATCKSKFLSFVEKHEQCFDRNLLIGHVTASAWLMNQEMSKALLTHHRKLNRWLQLGGHCEPIDKDILSTAIREAKEESGILLIEPVYPNIYDIDIHRIPASAKEPAHFHYDVRFLLRTIEKNAQPIRNEESKQLKWIAATGAEIPTNDPSVVRLFTKWKVFLGQS